MNRHLGLFLLTVLTTTAAGAGHYSDFLDTFGTVGQVSLSWTQLALGGLWFSVPFLGFLTAHEFGHYFAGRWHGLRPSLPYYLPAPLPLTGIARRRHRLPRALPEPARPVRLRGRRAARRLRGGGHRARVAAWPGRPS